MTTALIATGLLAGYIIGIALTVWFVQAIRLLTSNRNPSDPDDPEDLTLVMAIGWPVALVIGLMLGLTVVPYYLALGTGTKILRRWYKAPTTEEASDE